MITKISRKSQAEFRAIVRRFNEFMKVVQETEEPNAELYLDGGGNLNLMDGPHHRGGDAIACPENVVVREYLDSSDGGDW